MMSKIDYGFKNRSIEGALGECSGLKIRASYIDRSMDSVASTKCSLEDLEVVKCRSYASSFSEDSGFNSDNEFGDDVIENMKTTHCDFDNESEAVNAMNCKFNCETKIVQKGNCDDNDVDKVKKINGDFSSEGENVNKENFGCCDHESDTMNKENFGCCDHESDTMNKENFGCCDHESDTMNKENFGCCDHESDTMNKENFGCCDHESDTMNKENFGCNSLELEHNRLTGCLQNEALDASRQRIGGSSLTLNASAELNSHLRIDSMNVNLDDINSGHTVSMSLVDSTRSHRSGTANSYEDSSNLQRRRCRMQDLNNNNPGSRDLNSCRRKAPSVKLQDCFHDKGLLYLIACIIYTLLLMVVIGVLGSLKSYIGTQNLKKMRKDFVQYRRARMNMATG